MQPNEKFIEENSISEMKLSRKQESVILALLNHPTTQEAAKVAGVSDVTLWRWLQTESFQRAYLTARREAVKQAMAQIQQRTSEAVNVLNEIMKSKQEPSGVRVSAAKAIIEYAVKTLQVEDLEQRIFDLEARANFFEGMKQK